MLYKTKDSIFLEDAPRLNANRYYKAKLTGSLLTNLGLAYGASKALNKGIEKGYYNKNTKIKSLATGAAYVSSLVAVNKAYDKVFDRAYRYLNAADYKPKSWISRKIASLRRIYHSWLIKSKSSKSSRLGSRLGSRISMFKTMARKLLIIIDKLLEKLEHAVE